MKKKKDNFEVEKIEEDNVENKQEHEDFIQAIQSLKRMRFNKILINYIFDQ